jgi:RNA polymerase sigma-70 factor, ECF subfamily
MCALLAANQDIDGGQAIPMTRSADRDLAAFESHRALLTAHAYRMLGDLARAEDIVQDAWLKWAGKHEAVISPRAYLVTLVTRLCLNELDSARSRREESRGDRLPEPAYLEEGGLARVEMLDRISMAFMVALQRLTPAERAVLLLRDVFEFDYSEIAALVERSEVACRKLLERARENVAKEKRLFAASPEVHRRLLTAFHQAAQAGDLDALVSVLRAGEWRDFAIFRRRWWAHGRSQNLFRRPPAARISRPKYTNSTANRRWYFTKKAHPSPHCC